MGFRNEVGGTAMEIRRTAVAALAVLSMVAAGGCKKTTDNAANLKSGLNAYFDAHPVCLYTTEKKFPAQADTNNESDTAGYDALVQQGLLTRTTAEKTKLLILSKSVNNYDLSNTGRSVWTADATQPGYGNFCYGKRKVGTITSTPPGGDPLKGSTTIVNYTYTIGDVADWARAAIVQNAFPSVQAKLAAASNGTATMVLGANGWTVQAPAGSVGD